MSNQKDCLGTKVLFIIADGLGDYSIPELNFQTPLEAAHTPTFDSLIGLDGTMTGLLDPVYPGLACGSDTAHMNIFGYPPRKLPSLHSN